MSKNKISYMLMFLFSYSQLLFGQDTIRRSYSENIYISEQNQFLNEIVNINGWSSHKRIVKSSMNGKITWAEGPIIFSYQEMTGLYQSAFNDSFYVTATGGFNGGILKFFGYQKGQLLKEIENKNKIAYKGISFSKNNKQLFAVDDKGYFQVIDMLSFEVVSNKRVFKCSENYNCNTWSLYSYLNDSLFIIGMKNRLVIYDRKLNRITSDYKQLSTEVDKVSISRDKAFFSVVSNKRVLIFKQSGELYREIVLPYETQAVDFTLDGKWICFSKNGLSIQYCNFQIDDKIFDYPRINKTNSTIGDEKDEVMFIKFLQKSITISTLKGIYFRYFTNDSSNP